MTEADAEAEHRGEAESGTHFGFWPGLILPALAVLGDGLQEAENFEILRGDVGEAVHVGGIFLEGDRACAGGELPATVVSRILGDVVVGGRPHFGEAVTADPEGDAGCAEQEREIGGSGDQDAEEALHSERL